MARSPRGWARPAPRRRSARRWGTTPSRSWCPATGWSRPVEPTAGSRRRVVSTRSCGCWRSRARRCSDLAFSARRWGTPTVMADDLPTLGTLDELAELLDGRDDLYVRWSRGPDVDVQTSSRDDLTVSRYPVCPRTRWPWRSGGRG